MKQRIEAEMNGWECRMEGIGFEGKICDSVMRDFENALGPATERKNKAEYFKVKVRAGKERQR
jgi:hypothetical protein